MPTTRRQAAIAEGKNPDSPDHDHEDLKPKSKSKSNHPPKKSTSPHKAPASRGNGEHGKKRSLEQADNITKDEAPTEESKGGTEESPPKTKKLKTNPEAGEEQKVRYQTGTIERGHIYFFYRPRVQLEEVHSVDDIRNFHILLVPRPPEFAVYSNSSNDQDTKKEDSDLSEEAQQKVLAPGADAVPAPADSSGGSSKSKNKDKKKYRLITVGKKTLPDPDAQHGGSRRKETFFAIVTSVGDDFQSLEEKLGPRTYETKTRGERHEGPVRLVARGGYAIVNAEARTPSQRETHLGYHVSHPPPSEMGDVQKSLGIYSASSFILQVKNPAAPATGPQQVHSKGADYPDWIMRDIFGAGGAGNAQSRGKEDYGLRFVSCEVPELLDYQNAALLLIAAREGEEGLETSLSEGRGKALTEMEKKESHQSIRKVFDELGLDLKKFPAESLEGSWI